MARPSLYSFDETIIVSKGPAYDSIKEGNAFRESDIPIKGLTNLMVGNLIPGITITPQDTIREAVGKANSSNNNIQTTSLVKLIRNV